MTTGAEAGCWLWAEFNEMAMPSNAKAKMPIANRTKIMTLTARLKSLDGIQHVGGYCFVIDITFCCFPVDAFEPKIGVS